MTFGIQGSQHRWLTTKLLPFDDKFMDVEYPKHKNIHRAVYCLNLQMKQNWFRKCVPTHMTFSMTGNPCNINYLN